MLADGRTQSTKMVRSLFLHLTSVLLDNLVALSGFKFEMGGTWVSHNQPNTFRELVRYGLDRDLTLTRHAGHENDYFSLKLAGNAFDRPSTTHLPDHDRLGSMRRI